MTNVQDDQQKAVILLVDDSYTSRELLGTMLMDSDYMVSIAENGLTAIELVKEKKPDLILLDIIMPDIDGYEVCSRLKKNSETAHIPVIFLTALTDKDSLIKAFEMGGVDYISKPYLYEEVMARINVHVNLKKVMEKLESISITDELTGIYNRRYAYKILERYIALSEKGASDFLLCYLDIDNLKTINDTCGHDAGDLLIKTVVSELVEEVRITDFIFRMGGDEFLILFPRAEMNEAKGLIQRIQNILNTRYINDIPVDFSYGFTQYHSSQGLSCDDIIKEADASMYREKMLKKGEDCSDS